MGYAHSAEDYASTAEALLAEMRNNAGDWDWLRRHIMPRTQAGANHEERQASSRKRMHSTAAIKALRVLTGAHIMYITPTGQQWFAIKSGLKGKKKSARHDEWFAEATETIFGEIGRSNFYTELHECFLDRCLTGTGCLFCEATPAGKLNFRHIPTGTYGIAEGAEGLVDTLARSFRLSPHQAVQQFGYRKLPERIREAWDEPKSRYTAKFEFVHLVMPRTRYEFGHDALQSRRMKWASVYMAWDAEKKVLKEDGYNEFPYLVTRFLRNGEGPFGYGPGLDVKEEIAATLKLERVMDVLGEVAAFPRILQLADQVGEVDLRAGGITTVKAAAAELKMPREWASSGRYDVGKDRIDEKERKIREAFFVDMLMPLAEIERQMTATEVNARQGEKILAFSPSFTLFISDCNVLIHRIFSVLFRLGRFAMDEVPDELKVPDMGGSENFEIELPAVEYLGHISQAIARAQQSGIEYFMQVALTYTQATGDTAMIEYVEPRKFAKFLYERTGSPTECRRTEAQLRELDAQKKEAADMQRKLQATQGARDAAAAQKDLAAMPPQGQLSF
ncbi:portal protein [Akkermansia glycaniphila]|uniref:Bacteriophage head to tail connecting protein n=2 Tax=Akkermansia TaxID=239934 RepID=A0A1C7PFC8_9BACT|nr:portal protein [Akkermansia glycaniphila]OCA04257.1 hypothetical protein AC781_00800 [Akkermansia glycaniphila]SEH97166.1 bacteriophage head to tail connecting protein [Akkermansia glycaniphila]